MEKSIEMKMGLSSINHIVCTLSISPWRQGLPHWYVHSGRLSRNKDRKSQKSYWNEEPRCLHSRNPNCYVQLQCSTLNIEHLTLKILNIEHWTSVCWRSNIKHWKQVYLNWTKWSSLQRRALWFGAEWRWSLFKNVKFIKTLKVERSQEILMQRWEEEEERLLKLLIMQVD